MPLVSGAPQTIKDKLIRDLRQLPEDLLKGIYKLELIEKRALMQKDQWLADKYSNDNNSDGFGLHKGWLEFKVGDWFIKMEWED